jgi:hypothetical protein
MGIERWQIPFRSSQSGQKSFIIQAKIPPIIWEVLALKRAPMQTQLPIKEMTKAELVGIIAALQEELEEREWDEILAHPKSKAFLKKLTEETKAQIEAGEIEEGGFDCSEEQTH